jgi:hypothetical protein
VISRGLPTMWLHANNLRCVVCCKPEDWFVLLKFRLLYIHFINIINNDISPITVWQFNPNGFHLLVSIPSMMFGYYVSIM